MPTVSRKLAVVAGFALTAGALGGGVALAGSSSVRPAVKSAPAVVGSASSSAARPATVVKAVAPKAVAPKAAAPKATAPRTASSQSEDPSAPDTDNIQEGDQTTPDAAATASASESGSEQDTESATESDGPGGHADPAGDVDHQFEGVE